MRIALVSFALAVLVLGPSASAGPNQRGSFTLTVSVSGNGQVTSSPGGINCPSTCSAKFTSGTTVGLSRNPGAGWTFAGWSGACSGTGACSVTMNSDKSVGAVFEFTPPPKQRFTLTVTVAGNGSVVSNSDGITCPTDCTETYDEGTSVTLAPLAGANAVFTGWDGACSGLGTCTVKMDASKTAAATFVDRRPAPPQAEPGPDTGKPGRGTSGPPFELNLPFTCAPTGDLWLDSVFRDMLGRPADAAALDVLGGQLEKGTPRADIAQLVLSSLEYRTRLIQSYYARFLKRQPSNPELAALLDLLGSTRDETIEAYILGGNEYFVNRGGSTNDGFVDALYQDLLGRTPSSSERTTLVNQLAQGTSREDLAAFVLKSAEARTRLIQNLYQSLLGRPPSQAEVDAFLARYAQGATNEAIAAAVLASQEYVDKSVKFEATINWGDGMASPGQVEQTGGRCTVVGTHSYRTNGDKRVETDVTSPDGSKDTFVLQVQITPPPPPPPGKENVRPQGTVFVKKGGTFVPLTGFEQLPVGTELDTRRGSVEITTHDGSVGRFYEGIFRIGAEKVRKITFTTIVLTGGNFGVCNTKKRTISATGAKKPPPKSVRHVWGNAKGHFRTKGKYASATIRGTLWLTDDQCPGTRVSVRIGTVDVYDFVKRKHIFVHAKHTYLATPKK